MKVKTISIQSEHEATREFERVFEAARKRLPFKPKSAVHFTSLAAARNFLTPKRLELIHLIKERRPRSLYELAKLAGRNFPSVLRDVGLLSRHGLVTLSKRKESPRRPIHPSVGYDAINLWIGV